MALKTKTFNRRPLPSDVIVNDALPAIGGGTIIMKSNGSTAREVDAGTVIGKFTSDGKGLELTPAAEDGTEDAFAVVVESVTVPATGDLEVEIRQSHTVLNADKLIWPSGILAESKTAALAALAAKFIKTV